MPAPSSAPAPVGWRVSLLFLFSLAALLAACSEPTPPPPPPDSATVALSLVEEDYTSITLKLMATGTDTATSFTLLRNGAVTITGRLFGSDTILIDSPLVPSTGYRYQALRFRGAAVDSSALLAARTKDTTDHDFVMETYVFGDDGNSSGISNVAFVDDTLAFAVGDIETRDSSGNWASPYNLVVWNGIDWTLRKVPYKGSPGPISTVCAVAPNDVWLSTVLRWDGSNFRELPADTLFYLSNLRRMWGSRTGVYAVGAKGLLARYNGWKWERVQTGTNVLLPDVYGYFDARLGRQVVLCPVSDYNEISERKILRVLENSTVDTISWGPKRLVQSVWCDDLDRIFAGGEGVFIRNRKGGWEEQTALPQYYADRIRGAASNDVFVAMSYGHTAITMARHGRYGTILSSRVTHHRRITGKCTSRLGTPGIQWRSYTCSAAGE